MNITRLDRNVAMQELAKVKNPRWGEERWAALSNRTPLFRKAAAAVLDRVEDELRPELTEPQAWAATLEYQQSVAALKDDERAELFQSLFPAMAPAVEHAWQMRKLGPTGDDTPFRSPHVESDSADVRFYWLKALAEVAGPYPQPVSWLAAWAPWLTREAKQLDALGWLFAGAIDAEGAEGEEVFRILVQSATGEHAVGSVGWMAHHVVRGLLCSQRPEGLELLGRLLLNAGREDGVHTMVLQHAHIAHPGALRHLLQLIVDHGLTRFPSVAECVNGWLKLNWDAHDAAKVALVCERLLGCLSDEKAREQVIAKGSAEDLHLALWADALEDLVRTSRRVRELLVDQSVERRFAAVKLLYDLQDSQTRETLVRALDDADLRVACLAAEGLGALNLDLCPDFPDAGAFEALEKLLARVPETLKQPKPLVWSWRIIEINRARIELHWSNNRGKRPLIATHRPHLARMSVFLRTHFTRELGDLVSADDEARELALALAGDADKGVRAAAFAALHATLPAAEKLRELEALCARPADDIRQEYVKLLLKYPDDVAVQSATRLVTATTKPSRLAGLELLQQLAASQRVVMQCQEAARAVLCKPGKLSAEERQKFEALSAVKPGPEPTLEDGLGLLVEDELTQPLPPQERDILLHSPTTEHLIHSLDELLWASRELTVRFQDDSGTQQNTLLAEMRLPWPDLELSVEEDRLRFPLASLCGEWWLNRPAELRDPDGYELVRLAAFLESSLGWQRGASPALEASALRTVYGTDRPQVVRNRSLILDIFRWLWRLHPVEGQTDFALAAMETSLARMAQADFHYGTAQLWLGLARKLIEPDRCEQVERVRRLWHCQLWLHYEGLKKKMYWDYYWHDLRRAYLAGSATDADVVYTLLAKRDARTGKAVGFWGQLFHATERRSPRTLSGRALDLNRIGERIVDRIVTLELTRAEAPTIVSSAALQVWHVAGVDKLMALLVALTNEKYARNYDREDTSGASVFSHLIFCCHPAETDTPEEFAMRVKSAGIREKRLIGLAVYAPQWAQFVEAALGWPGLTEAVRWIHAHTKTGEWTWRDSSKEFWQAGLSQHTALTADDLLDGAVDVAWFERVHSRLGDERWDQLYEAAKYACTGAGHTRARIFADAMLGRVTTVELIEWIKAKRHQDSVRALGLIPLPERNGNEPSPAESTEVLSRYEAIQEFIRGSKEFGAQRRESEKRAAQIGLDNLARTAGYADPIRLQWAMEARALGDFAEGPLTVTTDDVTVTLGIDPWGEVELNVSKAGKKLADVPAKLKKQPDIARLRERKAELKKQAARIRPSLEQLMVRGDTFSSAELRELMKHPFLEHMLSNLVLIGDGVAGYPVADGQALENHSGGVEAIKADERLRIAHPLDLLPAEQWHLWQKDCFAHQRVQPFKQVFRELYPLTKAEGEEGAQTRRYAGHQVQPRQALALLGARGWVHHPEEGVRKTFHEVGLTAWLEFQESFYTPADVEGLTVESVRFSKRGESAWGSPIKLAEVPPRLFSEAMRDLDLVVSVAHRSGVDPEASASTVEMRGALVEETCALLKITNVRVKDRFVLIDGALGSYTVHLGSAITRKMPGETLFIVPVHSQHRGRLFLPFADDDPKTAEVLSKMLLLARDKELKDPNILDQIRR